MILRQATAQHRMKRTLRCAHPAGECPAKSVRDRRGRPLNRLCPLEVLVPSRKLVLGETPLSQTVGPLSLNRKVLLMSDFQYFLKWLSENSCLSMRAAEITGRKPAHDILEDR